MKRPNLEYNHYYPFYTQSISGEKKYYYRINTIIHLSEDNGIIISRSYKQKKISEIIIERISDRTKLIKSQMEDKHLSYPDFSKEVEIAYIILSKAVINLSSKQAFTKTLIFTCYLKYNSLIEIELEYKKIHVKYDNFDYIIKNGKKIIPAKEESSSNKEEDILMKKISDAVSVINSHTTYRELENSEFDRQLNDNWNYFIEYFAAPKFIRKSEYILK